MDKENIPVVEHENQQLPLPIIQPQENDDLFKVYPSSKVTLKDKKETKIQPQNQNVVLSNNNNNNNMETQQEEEDFSFDTLRQRALNKIVLCSSRSHPSTATNASNGSNDTAVMEDFSFSTLKERAANPNKSNHHHHHSVVDKKQIKRGGMGLTSTPTKATMVKNNSTTSTTSSIPSEMNHHGCSKRPHLAPITIHPPYIHTPTKNSNNNNNTPHHKTNINSSTSKPTTPFDPNKYQFRPKIRKEEVQATDHSHASVQKLSQWLSNDPFDTKKQIVIRKGVQIANKARVFERGPTLEELLGKDSSCGGDGQSMSLSTKSTKALTRVQREQEYFRKGGVSEGKEWLKHAFGNGHGEETVSGGNGSGSGTHLEKTEVLCVQDKKRMFEQGMLFQQKKKN